MVENRPMNCTTCGAGPWHGREEQNLDRYTGEVIVECSWVCGRCGNRFAHEELRRIPAEKKENG